MRKGLIIAIVLFSILMIPMVPSTPHKTSPIHQDQVSDTMTPLYIEAAAGGNGDSFASTQFMYRNIDFAETLISNTYVTPEEHNATLDLSQFHMSGWTLYQVDFDLNNITATPEREVIGVTAQAVEDFQIDEPINDIYVDQLAQEFFSQPYNGSLLNYSLRYRALNMDPQYYGYAFTTVRSNNEASGTNMTSEVNVTASVPYVWTTYGGASANLSMNTDYWVVIDGSNLVEYLGVYPDLYWSSEDSTGSFDTAIHFSTWQYNRPNEALLNYTYVPWNQTTNSALMFNTSEVSLRTNASAINADSWSFSSTGNISTFKIDSNQSVNVNSNLTLWYKRTINMSSIWDVQISGNDIIWNLTATLSYPSFSTERFLNITVMPDWSAEDIYNGSSGTGAGTFTSYTGLVACYDMTNGTWTLRSDGPNYLTAMDISNNAGGVSLPTKASILTNLDIDTTVEDGSSNPATTGSTNFTVLNSTDIVWSNLQSVSGGSTTHLWDIDATTTKNGTYTLDLFWSNGTQAGYLSKQYVVYLPTTFTANEYTINGYTENSISIRVAFEDSFTSIGLNSTYATVQYSFDGDSNVTMDNLLLNGTWTASVSTANRIPGPHTIDVFAEGTAIQNQSLSITVNLIHQTQSLTVQWTNTDTITYTGTTTLRVLYRNATTFEDITTATVNVTDGTTTWPLKWNATSSFFEIQFNGSDSNPGIGAHSLTINAWQSGYLNQTDSTQTLTINIEPTGGQVLWMSNTIEWNDSVILRLNYTDSGTNLITTADIRVIYINGTEYPLSGGGNGTYWYIFDNSLGLGYFEIQANLTKSGYDPWKPTGITLTIAEETTDWTITWEPANVTLPYTYSLNLTVTYTYSGVDVPSSAVVNVTIDSNPYPLSWTGSNWYVSIPGDTIGIGVWSAFIQADLHGYQAQSNVTSNVNITLAANSFVVSPNTDTTITYAELVNITVIYTYESNPILGATVRVFINDTPYDATYSPNNELWFYTLTGVSADLGVWNITVMANKTGYDTGIDQFYLTVNADTPIVTTSWTTLSMEYVYDIPLSVNISASTLVFVDDAAVSIEINETPRAVINHGNGTYTAFFDRRMDLSLYTINVTWSRYGYNNASVILTLTIIDTQTELVVNVSDNDPYYDENTTITITYQLLNTTFVNPSNITLELDGINQTLVWNTDHWEISFVASNLGLGQHTLRINASAFGFENKTQTIIVEVLEIPTSFDIIGFNSMYVNDTITLRLVYTDTRTSTALTLDALVIGWDGSYVLSPASGGAYDLVLNSSSLHEGTFDLDLQIIETGFASTSNQTAIIVSPVPTAIVTSLSVQVFENETIVVTARLNDTYHNSWIHWASVSLELDDQNYTMEYDAINERYSVSIWMNHEAFATMNHVVTIYTEALDCVTSLAPVVITVRDKTDYVLAIDSDPVVIIGTDLGVHVTVLEGGDPAELVPVRVYAIITINGSPTEEVRTVRTNDEGLATASFTIPEGATEVEVWAEIVGTEESWYVATSSLIVVAQPPSDFFTLLMGILLSPQGMFLIFIGLIVVGIVGAYTRKLKPSRLAARSVLDQQLRTFRDLDSMQHFMAVYVDRGTCVFYHPFRSARIQADLISGFISAVTSVYGEIKGEDGVQGTLEEIHYQGLRLNSYSGQYVLGILILEKEISQRLRDRLQFFVEMFENEYDSHLKGWTGIVDCFDPEWIVSNLMTSFGYSWVVPHTIDDSVKMTGTERKIIGYIKASLGEKLEREFSISEYLQPIARMQKKSEAEVLDIFLKMEERGIIEPISVHTILLRQGLGLSGVDELVEEYGDYIEEEAEPVPEEAPLDEVIEAPVEEKKPKSKKKKKKKTKEPEPEPEPPAEEPETEPEPEEEIDPRDQFLEDVESLLKKEKEDKNEGES